MATCTNTTSRKKIPNCVHRNYKAKIFWQNELRNCYLGLGSKVSLVARKCQRAAPSPVHAMLCLVWSVVRFNKSQCFSAKALSKSSVGLGLKRCPKHSSLGQFASQMKLLVKQFRDSTSNWCSYFKKLGWTTSSKYRVLLKIGPIRLPIRPILSYA